MLVGRMWLELTRLGTMRGKVGHQTRDYRSAAAVPNTQRAQLGNQFYTSAGNPVKEILLKLNLPDHRSILTDSKVTPTKHGRMTKPYSSPRFIANCFNAGYLKMEVKVPDSS
ncbi:hypothetical protein Tco_0198895 [Tanacetum coccineum]